MLFSLLLAFSVSVDALGIGLSYGLRKIRFPYTSLLLLFSETFLMITAFLQLGRVLSDFFPAALAQKLSVGILFLFGFWLCLPKQKADSPLHTPTLCDKNNSSVLEPKEALLLGFILSMDSFAIGLSAASLEVPLLPLFAALFQTGFLFLGERLGNRLLLLNSPKETLWGLLSGGTLLLLAVFMLLK